MYIVDIKVKLGIYIKRVREMRGLTSRDFKWPNEVSPTTLHRIEHAKTDINLTTLEKVANVLDMPVYRLLENALAPAKTPITETTRSRPIHRWYSFSYGFSPDLIYECVQKKRIHDTDISLLDSNARILDMYTGSGTTLVEANNLGLASIGIEAHPFFHSISRAKTDFVRPQWRIEKLFDDLAAVTPDNDLDYSDDALKILTKFVPEENLAYLVAARKLQTKSTYKTFEDIIYLILSRVLILCSKANVNSVYLSFDEKKHVLTYLQGLELVKKEILADIELAGQNEYKNKSTIYRTIEDLREHPQTCDVLITSPPYLNNSDYAEMTRLYLYYWKRIEKRSDLTSQIRQSLIINNTSALTNQFINREEKYRKMIPEAVQLLLKPHYKRLKAEVRKAPYKKKYYHLIYPYFGQLTSDLRIAYNTLKNGATAHIIIGDSTLYEEHIPVHEYYKMIMEEIGFKDVSCIKIKARGNRWKLEKKKKYEKHPIAEYHIEGIVCTSPR